MIGRFLASCLAAFVGGHVVNYGVILYAQEVWQDPLLSGVGFFLCFGPPLLFGWYAGVLSDRRSPLAVVVGAHLVFMLAAAVLVLAVATPGGHRGWYLLGCALAGVGWSFVAPARLAALGRLVPSAQLHGKSVLFNLLVMLGYGLAPLLIAGIRHVADWWVVFAFAGAAFVLALPLLLGLRTPVPVLAQGSVATIAGGWRYVRSEPLLVQALVAMATLYLLMGPMQVMLPRFADQTLALTPTGRGLLLGTTALGLLVGGALALVLGRRIGQGLLVVVAIAVSGSALLALSMTGTAMAAALAVFVAAAAAGLGVSLLVAILQQTSDDAHRGRVMSFFTVLSQVTPALSGLFSGIALSVLAPAQGLALAGALLLLIALLVRWRARALGAVPAA